MGGRGGNNHKKFSKRREKGGNDRQNNQSRKKGIESYHFDKARTVHYDRPKWIPVILSTTPLPSPDCPICGKPIKDITSALTDRLTGTPAHFDCIITRIMENEKMEKGDIISYIGGGRFGIVSFVNPQDARNFTIKKIIEWEDKGNRAEWRQNVADHYSLT
jgi:hypothetical protein